METKKVNFKELKVRFELEGEAINFDLRKDIGNFIYQNSRDLGALELARKIYNSEFEIEITESELSSLKQLVEESKIMLPLRLALLNL